MVTKGYLNKDDLNKINLKNGWFYSGDTGYMDNDGYLYYIGRKDDVINLGGLKVSPEEIEEVLINFNGICDSAVIGIKSERCRHQ